MINSRKILNLVAGWGMLIALSACNGVMDGIYDDPQKPAQGDLYVDATSWTEWHYVKFNNSQLSTLNHQLSTLTIPTTPIAEFDADGTGIYNYWYDVFGEGMAKHELRSKYPTIRQPEPDQWDIAIHRNNVRTNGGAVWQSSLTDISKVGGSTQYSSMPFVEDSWSEIDVWVVQDQMLSGIVGSQRIKINTELSKWLTMEIPPMPPAFVYNGNVFIVRLSDGTYAALRLKNYKTPDGRNCGMTIEYKYPL